MDERLYSQIENYREDMQSWFDWLHVHPDLSNEEQGTSDFLAKLLESWGYDVVRGIGGTGIVASLTRGEGKHAIGLRSEMDALPIQENSTCHVQSERPGKAHLCGHDGHMTMLLGGARYLAEHGNFSGTVRIIFQPAEEHIGGSRGMLRDGLLERFPMDAMFGMHNTPGLEPGKVYLHAGPVLTASDEWNITVTGKGGHGSMPHHAIDPIVAASSIVMAIQSIVARNADPHESTVVTVGAFNSGVAPNVIPDTAELKVGVRSTTPESRKLLLDRLRTVAMCQAESYGAKCEIEELGSCPAVMNNPELKAKVADLVLARLGEQNVEVNGPSDMASDDFAFYTYELPCVFAFIGNGDTLGNHNPGYTFNQGSFVPGAAYWVALTEGMLVE